MFASNTTNVNEQPDAQFNYVTMLLHGDGTNGAQNNTFTDSSTNNFTITRNGNNLVIVGVNGSISVSSTLSLGNLSSIRIESGPVAEVAVVAVVGAITVDTVQRDEIREVGESGRELLCRHGGAGRYEFGGGIRQPSAQGVEVDRHQVLKDYFHEDAGWHIGEALEVLCRSLRDEARLITDANGKVTERIRVRSEVLTVK